MVTDLNPHENIHYIHNSQRVVRTVISILHSLLLQTIFNIPSDTYYKYTKSKDLQMSLDMLLNCRTLPQMPKGEHDLPNDNLLSVFKTFHYTSKYVLH